MKTKLLLIALFLLFSVGIQRATAQSPVPLGMEDVVWQKEGLSVASIAFSPTQPYVAVGTTSWPVLLDLNTGVEIKKFICKNSITGLKFTNDGNYLFTGSTDGQLIKWNTQNWDSVIIDDITHSSKCINMIDYNQARNIFATASDSYGCVIYDANTNQIIDRWSGMPIVDLKLGDRAVVNTVSFRNDGKVIAIGMIAADATWLYDLDTKQIIKKIKGEDGLYSPTKNELIVKKIKDSNGSELLDGLDYYKFDESENPVNINIEELNTELAYSYIINGSKIIIACRTGFIKVYNLINFSKEHQFDIIEKGTFNILAVSENNNFLLTRTKGILYLLNIEKYTNVGVQEMISTINISPNPTNDLLNIEYTLTKNTNIQITLSDIQGVFLGEIYSGFQESGIHSLNYPILNLPSGTYFININVNGSISSKKFVIAK